MAINCRKQKLVKKVEYFWSENHLQVLRITKKKNSHDDAIDATKYDEEESVVDTDLESENSGF